MDCTAVLVGGARLGEDEADENPKSKKKVCVLSKPFKTRKRPRNARHPVEEMRRSRRAYIFGPDEGNIRNPCMPRKLYETEFGYANLKVAYVQQTSIVPSDGR
jgi:hypothetical protein